MYKADHEMTHRYFLSTALRRHLALLKRILLTMARLPPPASPHVEMAAYLTSVGRDGRPSPEKFYDR
jgi:hypothetical protein